MKHPSLPLVALVSALLWLPISVSAETPTQEDNMAQMAQILLKLNHYPSNSEKATLQAISKKSAATAQERILANAILNINHQVNPADEPLLQNVMQDNQATNQQQSMASIIMKLNHKPGKDDKVVLSKILE